MLKDYKSKLLKTQRTLKMNMIIGKISNRNFIIFLLGLDPLHNQLETTSLNLVKKYTEE